MTETTTLLWQTALFLAGLAAASVMVIVWGAIIYFTYAWYVDTRNWSTHPVFKLIRKARRFRRRLTGASW